MAVLGTITNVVAHLIITEILKEAVRLPWRRIYNKGYYYVKFKIIKRYL